MNTLKFSIKVDAIDSYIYSGHLFLILKNGDIVFTELAKIIGRLASAYPNFENLIRLTFQRNDYYSNRQGLMYTGIGEVKRVLTTLWERAVNEIVFEIQFDINDFKTISTIPSMPVLDMKLYAMRMYLGCKEGLFETKLNPEERYFLYPSKPRKCFDAKVTHLNAKSGEVVISANSEGLFHGNFFNKNNFLKVTERPAAKKSIRTGWSGYDIMNYEDHNNFEYFVNKTNGFDNKPEYSKFDETSERKRITEFGKATFDMEKLLARSELSYDNILYCFNSSSQGFFFTRDGSFVNINLNKGVDNEMYFTSKSHQLPNLGDKDIQNKRPVSSSIVPKGCVVEYFDKVVLYQNGKAKIIETTPSINVRTYPSSIRYRNIVTVTKQHEVSVHSIFPFEEKHIQLTFDDFKFDNPEEN